MDDSINNLQLHLDQQAIAQVYVAKLEADLIELRTSLESEIQQLNVEQSTIEEKLAKHYETFANDAENRYKPVLEAIRAAQTPKDVSSEKDRKMSITVTTSYDTIFKILHVHIGLHLLASGPSRVIEQFDLSEDTALQSLQADLKIAKDKKRDIRDKLSAVKASLADTSTFERQVRAKISQATLENTEHGRNILSAIESGTLKSAIGTSLPEKVQQLLS